MPLFKIAAQALDDVFSVLHFSQFLLQSLDDFLHVRKSLLRLTLRESPDDAEQARLVLQRIDDRLPLRRLRQSSQPEFHADQAE